MICRGVDDRNRQRRIRTALTTILVFIGCVISRFSLFYFSMHCWVVERFLYFNCTFFSCKWNSYKFVHRRVYARMRNATCATGFHSEFSTILSMDARTELVMTVRDCVYMTANMWRLIVAEVHPVIQRVFGWLLGIKQAKWLQIIWWFCNFFSEYEQNWISIVNWRLITFSECVEERTQRFCISIQKKVEWLHYIGHFCARKTLICRGIINCPPDFWLPTLFPNSSRSNWLHCINKWWYRANGSS